LIWLACFLCTIDFQVIIHRNILQLMLLLFFSNFNMYLFYKYSHCYYATRDEPKGKTPCMPSTSGVQKLQYSAPLGALYCNFCMPRVDGIMEFFLLVNRVWHTNSVSTYVFLRVAISRTLHKIKKICPYGRNYTFRGIHST
jgi:hypothetical protein